MVVEIEFLQQLEGREKSQREGGRDEVDEYETASRRMSTRLWQTRRRNQLKAPLTAH